MCVCVINAPVSGHSSNNEEMGLQINTPASLSLGGIILKLVQTTRQRVPSESVPQFPQQ